MPSTVVLHVGLMKSGTTFVQQHLFAHRGLLAAQSVLVTAKTWSGQVAAAKDVLSERVPDRWTPLARDLGGHDGRAVLSMEFFAPAVRRQRERIVAPLRPARLEVVITARDLNRTLLARWQEMIQNGKTFRWPEYVEGIRASLPSAGGRGAAGSGRAFWRHHDLPAIAEAWGEVADRVTVVTVPHPGADRRTLLDRFTEAAGLPELPLVETTRANESLGGASALALLRMNELLAERDVDFMEGRKVRKELLAKRLLAARRPDEPKLGLPVSGWLTEEAADQVRRTSRLPIELVGDWADLTPVPVPGLSPQDVPESEVAEAAIAGLAGLIQHWPEHQGKA